MYKSYKESTMANSKLKVIIFLGSTREGRQGLRVAKFVEAQLKSKYDLTVLDAEELDLPMLKKALHHYQDRSKAPKVLLDCDAKIKAADAFIVLAAEYNHSITPALSNMLDHFPPSSFCYKPSGIISYSMGPYAGMRAAMNLRCFLSEVGTLSVSNIFGVPEVHKALDENGKPMNEHLVPGLNRLVTQLDWYAHAMKNHRTTAGVPN